MASAWGLSWGSSWGNSWGLLTVPHFTLSWKQQVQVRTTLASVYTESEVDQAITAAAQNNLCVLDAISALRISAEPLQVFIRNERKAKAETPVREPRQVQPNPESKTLPACVISRQQQAFTNTGSLGVVAATTTNPIIVVTGESTLFSGA